MQNGKNEQHDLRYHKQPYWSSNSVEQVLKCFFNRLHAVDAFKRQEALCVYKRHLTPILRIYAENQFLADVQSEVGRCDVLLPL